MSLQCPMSNFDLKCYSRVQNSEQLNLGNMGEGVLDENVSITCALAQDFTFEYCFEINTGRINTTHELYIHRAEHATPSCVIKPANNFISSCLENR